ncbi:MAG: hypothetical protein KJ955_04130 [Nanoarchaeota archaeon]|nr:hypothetical protein [Nanoarchaeota archaeon]
MEKKKAAGIAFAVIGLVFLILWFYNLMAHGSMLLSWIYLAVAAVMAYLSKRMNK